MQFISESPLHTATESPLHVLGSAVDTFDITCLRLDSAFVTWINSAFGSSWDGTMPGTLAFGWSYFDGPTTYRISAFTDPLSHEFEVALFDFAISLITPSAQWTPNTTGPGGAGIPIFGGYSRIGGSGPAGLPSTLTVLPCDLVNPPVKLSFYTDVAFNTPAGLITIPPSKHILHRAAPLTPFKWSKLQSSSGFDFEFTVIQDATDAYCLMGCVPSGDTMQYAEFDFLDVPAAPPSPVGIFQRGNVHGFDGLPAGITWAGNALGSTTLLSVIGQ